MVDDVFRIPAFPVSSSNIHAIGYDEDKRILAIEFHAGTVYHYADVSPELAIDLVNAPSIGRFYNQNIKGKLQGQKMTGHCPNCGIQARVGETCPDCGTARIVDDKPKEAHDEGRDRDGGGSEGRAARDHGHDAGDGRPGH